MKNFIISFFISAFVISLSSCTSILYYKIENQYTEVHTQSGFIEYVLVTASTEIKLSKNEIGVGLAFNKHEGFSDFYNKYNFDTSYTYWHFYVSYGIVSENSNWNRDFETPLFKLEVDSVQIILEKPFESFYLSNYYQSNYEAPVVLKPRQLLLTPIPIPIEYKRDFILKLDLSIFDEKGKLLEVIPLELKAEYKKKTYSPFNPKL